MKHAMQSSKPTLVMLILLLITACSTHQPKNINALQSFADLSDTVYPLSGTHTIFYETRKIDNKLVINSSASTRKRSLKHGFNMNPNAITHRILPQTVSINVGLFNYHKADLFGLADSIYPLKGTLTLNAEANGSYKVNGVSEERYSLIWIEDQKSGLIMSDILRSANATDEDVQKVITEKANHYEKRLQKIATQEKENKEALKQALAFSQAGGCKGKTTEGNPNQIYFYAKSLFENKHHKEALSCFLCISEHSNAPTETFKYLSTMYDLGLGTDTDLTQADYWMNKYKTSNGP